MLEEIDALLDLKITQYMQVSKHHILLHKYLYINKCTVIMHQKINIGWQNG
jgi:lipoate synthase